MDDNTRTRKKADFSRVRGDLTPDASPAANYAFDITPRHLITGLITERGICDASADSLKRLFPEMG